MSTIEASVDVQVPVRTAYNQWTQFESFPRFMDGVRRVDREKSTLTHWVTRCGGVTREFDAEIVEQRPDERLVWRSLDRPRHSGTVTFAPLDDDLARVTLRIDFAPRGLLERAGDVAGVVHRRVHSDLKNFKEFIEVHGSETGQWRGAISDSRVRPDSGQDRPRVPDWPSG
ncbi:SRPBCC family protein [Streptomyces sp. NPDC093544]|jgi:uncharacterized membrane protein|uniref:SRPBCC family protein n=1 Tax=Streptomyces sp. NPDC093544 TaxID=3155200 RepID=UPI00342A3714